MPARPRRRRSREPSLTVSLFRPGVRGVGSFDALIKELSLAKSLDTAEDDERIAAAAGEDGEDGGDGGGEMHPTDAAVATVLRKVTDVVSALRRELDEIRAELGALNGRGGKPMAK